MSLTTGGRTADARGTREAVQTRKALKQSLTTLWAEQVCLGPRAARTLRTLSYTCTRCAQTTDICRRLLRLGVLALLIAMAVALVAVSPGFLWQRVSLQLPSDRLFLRVLNCDVIVRCARCAVLCCAVAESVSVPGFARPSLFMRMDASRPR